MGALFGIEVFYIHELHRESVRLPRLPLTWDAKFVKKVEHHRPAKWEQFVERLCAIDCVRSVRYDPQALGSRVKLLDGYGGVIGVCYGTPPRVLPLRVETTARGEAQTALVAEYFQKLR